MYVFLKIYTTGMPERGFARDATDTPNFGRSVNPNRRKDTLQDFFRITLHMIKRCITDYSFRFSIHFQEKKVLVFTLNK